MTREKRPGALRNALTWFGAGLVAGALLWLIVVALAYGGGAFGGSFWWVISALVGVLALVLVLDRRDDSEEATTSRYVFRMVPLAGVGLLTAALTFPRDSFEATTRGAWAFEPSPTEVHLWAVTCAIGLGCALLLFCLRRPDPRPLLRSLPFAGTGALAVALTGTLVGTLLLPWVPQQVADDLADPAPIPANVTRMGWEWRPPMGAEVTDVLPGSHGPLVLLRDGAVALDGTDGAELWSYRHPYDPVDDVWVHEENVYVQHQVGTDDGGEDLFETVALDSATGEVLDEDSDAVELLGGGVRAHGHELLAETLDLPKECVVSQAAVHDRLLVGAFGCLEDAEAGTVERSIETADPFGWDHIGARATVVAIDPLTEIELWRMEWDAPPGAWGPRLIETPTTWAERSIIVEGGPEERTAVLEPATGDELITLPDGSEADDFRGVVHADPHGSTIAFDTDRLEYTFHRAGTSGEITDTAVLTGTHIDSHIGSEKIVVSDDALVILQTYGQHADDQEVTVQVAPFGETTDRDEGLVHRADREVTMSSGEPTLTLTPGAVVLLSEDERSQLLEGLVS